ncbi:MAG: Stk1 family PASTA domain-containing Ser/Thr kinase [Solirubrobacteraceae bacterium]
MVEAGTLIDGRYKVLSRIGSGGMADVYLAEDELLGRRMALKLLHHRFAADQEFVERFRREASSAAGLSHPNVVAVFDRGEWDGTYYIAMEYLPGRSLKSVIREHGPLSPQDAIDITTQIVLALRFAHKRGIIHRDIKPHNVILDEEGRAKVTDFGIARAGASDMTLTGSIMGTAQYLSPEQAQGHAVTEASDLYAVGVVLYELLTGSVPFDGESAVTIAMQQVTAEPVPPSRRNPAVGPALDAVVLRALAKDPAQRYATADELLAALAQAREGVVPAAAPNGAPTAPTALLVPPAVPPAAGAAAAAGLAPAVAAATPLLPLEDGPAAERRNRWMWWALGAAALLAAAVALLLLLLGPSTRQVTVPNVTGQSQAAAVSALKHAGLHPVLQPTANASVPSGSVIGTTPVHGTRVQEGSSVTLFVSTGPGSQALPDVTGKPVGEAVKILKEKGFVPKRQTQSSETVAKGHVVSTDPAPATEVQLGGTVTVFVSSGPEKVKVPEVKGEPEAQATSALEAAGLKAKVQKREVEEPSPGTVISQSPAAGSQVKPGSAVTLVVAQASTGVTVPSLLGESEGEALSTLNSLGLGSKVVSRTVTDPSKEGLVVHQNPGAGAKLHKGDVVTIAIGKLASQTTSTSPTPTPPAAAPSPTPSAAGSPPNG